MLCNFKFGEIRSLCCFRKGGKMDYEKLEKWERRERKKDET